jgi:hypothetical protein
MVLVVHVAGGPAIFDFKSFVFALYFELPVIEVIVLGEDDDHVVCGSKFKEACLSVEGISIDFTTRHASMEVEMKLALCSLITSLWNIHIAVFVQFGALSIPRVLLEGQKVSFLMMVDLHLIQFFTLVEIREHYPCQIVSAVVVDAGIGLQNFVWWNNVT